ncbi:MAG: exosortase family protein XrtG [Eubacteriales bacterium]|nr:exosortase family protein XrtG [Oscillospiraceae bacterium]MBR0395202.1 exosortase family protein XrtG [Clostridiales bacterium]MDO4421736.1 exosortase family protein XrtG [Eubacteriales bacterium]
MIYVVAAAAIGLWVWLLRVLRKAGLKFWRYLLGSCGIFLILLILVRPWLVLPLARLIAAIAGIFGKVTGFYQAYYRYGVIFIESLNGAITVNIDLECSGFIEISAFISLLAFYGIYNIPERIYIGVIGTLYTMLTNALRIAVICTMIHFLGTDYYYVAHTIVGRIVFYVLQVILYFYIFTKPHVLKMKTGDFGYNKKEEITSKSGGDAQ